MKSTPEPAEADTILGAPIRPEPDPKPDPKPDTWTHIRDGVWRNDRTGHFETRRPIPPVNARGKPRRQASA